MLPKPLVFRLALLLNVPISNMDYMFERHFMLRKRLVPLFFYMACFTGLIVCTLIIINPFYAHAESKPRFSFPLDCDLTNDCWIVKYVDLAPDPGKVLDYNCGPHSEDGHNGVDIAIRDIATMQHGISIKAAETGTVIRIRDNIDDFMPTVDDISAMKRNNTSCGNGILIEHEDGWQSLYCHMKKHSINAKVGEKIRRGEKIGEIGHSGLTQFPHLHFEVFHNKKTIDPFTGYSDTEGCHKNGHDLWRSDNVSMEKVYQSPSIIAAGFSVKPPDFDKVRMNADVPTQFGLLQKSLFFWVGYYSARKNDIIELEIFAPDGSLYVKKTIVQEISRPRQFYYIGRNTRTGKLEHGIYTGVATIKRPTEGRNIIKDIQKKAYID